MKGVEKAMTKDTRNGSRKRKKFTRPKRGDVMSTLKGLEEGEEDAEPG